MSLILSNCDNCKGTGKARGYLHFEGFEYITFETCKVCGGLEQ